MAVFEKVTIKYDGKEYTIQPTEIMRAIAIVEDVVTLHELSQMSNRGTVSLSKIAMAYGALLRYAGASPTDEEVYASLFSSMGPAVALQSVQALLGMMVPRNLVPTKEDIEASGNSEADDAKSSKKRIKQSSAKPAG